MIRKEAELMALVVEWVKKHAHQNAGSGRELLLDEDTNLIESGLLDSLAFVELLLYVESAAGLRVDIADMDPAGFTTVRGFCSYAARSPDSRAE